MNEKKNTTMTEQFQNPTKNTILSEQFQNPPTHKYMITHFSCLVQALQ